MKILLIGANNKWAIERYYVNYLTKMGVDIYHFPVQDIIFQYHSKNLFNKFLFKSKINTGYKKVNKQFIKIAHEYKPDVIWVFKGMEILPATLDILRKNFKIVNYNPDHPFIISSRGSGNNNVKQSVGKYNLHFCYHKELQKKIEMEYGIPTRFLPFAFEEEDITFIDQSKIEEINKVCFQANPDDYRVSKINLLTQNGIEVDVFGHHWQKTNLVNNNKVRIFPIATRQEFWKLNQEYRVQLNLFREYNFGSHNMRTFEIPAVGGIQVAPYSEEQAAFFQDGNEIFFFNNDEEMIAEIHKLLNMGYSEALTIRNAARKRSLESGYTFQDRAITVYNTFKNLL